MIEMYSGRFYKTYSFFFQVRGCSPAMGYSFAAGTTDGPGIKFLFIVRTSKNIARITYVKFI